MSLPTWISTTLSQHARTPPPPSFCHPETQKALLPGGIAYPVIPLYSHFRLYLILFLPINCKLPEGKEPCLAHLWMLGTQLRDRQKMFNSCLLNEWMNASIAGPLPTELWIITVTRKSRFYNPSVIEEITTLLQISDENKYVSLSKTSWFYHEIISIFSKLNSKCPNPLMSGLTGLLSTSLLLSHSTPMLFSSTLSHVLHCYGTKSRFW